MVKAHVDFEIVPGLTSTLAGPEWIGIPITHRDYASSFHVITGHHKDDGISVNWNVLTHEEGTLIFLMGMSHLYQIVTSLIREGKAETTPFAIVQWATQWQQNYGVGTLSNIEEVVAERQLSSPPVIIVGEVVQLQKELYHRGKLQGKHLLMPFVPDSKLAARFADEGAIVDYYERLKVTPMMPELPDLT